MRTLVESLRRLYQNGKVTIEKLQEMYNQGKITFPEYEYIIE